MENGSPTHTSESRRDWRGLALACLGLVFALNLAAFATRLWFTWVSGPYAATTGFEEFCLYNIWKVAHGHPLYEWPQKDPYLLTLYNAGFYWIYGAWATMWGTKGGDLVLSTRLLSVLSTLAAGFLHAKLLWSLVAPTARQLPAKIWIVGLTVLFWLGTSFIAWSSLSARPDIMAVAFALGGLKLFIAAREKDSFGWLLGSSVLFLVAWSIKQSVVLIFAGTLLHAMVTRAGWRVVLGLLLPFATLAAVILLRGDEAYRYNLFTAPKILRWIPAQAGQVIIQAVVLNPFYWVFGLAALAGFWRTPRWRRDIASGSQSENRQRALALIAVPSVAGAGVAVSIHGSSTNNMLEAMALVALLGSAYWVRRLGEPGYARVAFLGAGLLLAMALLPLLQLVQAARGEPYTKIAGVSVGNLTKLNREQLAEREKFAIWMDTLPKPLWIRDAMFQLPWFATQDRYPAFVLNYQFEADARRKGVLVGEGFAEVVKRRHFAALLLRADDHRFVQIATEVGYREASVPAEMARVPTEYGVEADALRLFLR